MCGSAEAERRDAFPAAHLSIVTRICHLNHTSTAERDHDVTFLVRCSAAPPKIPGRSAVRSSCAGRRHRLQIRLAAALTSELMAVHTAHLALAPSHGRKPRRLTSVETPRATGARTGTRDPDQWATGVHPRPPSLGHTHEKKQCTSACRTAIAQPRRVTPVAQSQRSHRSKYGIAPPPLAEPIGADCS